MRGYLSRRRPLLRWLAALALFFAAYFALRANGAAMNRLCGSVIFPAMRRVARLCDGFDGSVGEVLILTAIWAGGALLDQILLRIAVEIGFFNRLLGLFAIAPVILLLTLAIWICVGLVYVSGLVLGLLSTVIAFLGVAVLLTYSTQNGLILLLIAFLISPFGLPKLAFWLLGKVQDLKFAVQNVIYR